MTDLELPALSEHELLGQLCEEVFDRMERGLGIIKSHFPLATLEEKDALIEETELLLRLAVVIEPLIAAAAPGDGIAIITQFQIILTGMITSYEQEYIRETVVSNPARPVGRPAIDIPEKQLRFLVEHGFKTTDMAQMFECSCRTIQRRLKEFNIEYNVYTDISDSQLDSMVSDIVSRLPCCGIRSMQSMLRANGIVLQRERVRESLHRVDPVGMQDRLRSRLHRRQYNVPNPNSLWHIDGYHKLTGHTRRDRRIQQGSGVFESFLKQQSRYCVTSISGGSRSVWNSISRSCRPWRRECASGTLHDSASSQRSQ